jgi:hypothetical protein
MVRVPNGIPADRVLFANWFVNRPGQEIYDTVQNTPSRRSDVHIATVLDYLYLRQLLRSGSP